MIEVQAKIWRPKVVSRYTTPNLDDKDIDNLLDCGQYGKCLYKPKLSWNDSSTCHDIIVFQDAHHATRLAKDLTFDTSVDKESCIPITTIITKY